MSNAKNKATRFLSLVMVFAMMLGLIPVLQQNADAVYTDDNSFRLTLTPMYGNCYLKPEGAGDANSYRKGTESDIQTIDQPHQWLVSFTVYKNFTQFLGV